MLVLMRMDPGNRPDGVEEFAAECFRSFRYAWEDNAQDDEAYLYEPEDGYASGMDFTDGAADPEKILETAHGWNARIESDFDACLKQLTAHAETAPDGAVRWLSGRSTDIYELKKAAMALDGQVYTFADRALLVNRHRYLTSLIEPDQMAEIEADPASYVLFEVYPK